MPIFVIQAMATRLMILLIALAVISCSGTRPSNLGIQNMIFSNCPDSPNCVSSDSSDKTHRVSPYQFTVPPTEAWQAIRSLILKMPRTIIIEETDHYLHAECKSAVFGFVDDLELHLRKDEKIIAVRSASRKGHSDFGVNRRRIEDLRALLIEQKILPSR